MACSLTEKLDGGLAINKSCQSADLFQFAFVYSCYSNMKKKRKILVRFVPEALLWKVVGAH